MSHHPKLVGLDVGSSGIRAAELKYDKSAARYVVKRVAQIDLPAFAIVNGQVKEVDAVVSALKKLWRKGHFSTRKVAFGLTDTSVITRQLDLPWMPASDFKSALRYQVAEYIPVDIASVELDYVPLAEFQTLDQHGQAVDMMRILLVAANEQVVTGMSEVLMKARLEPIVADSSAFALIRMACGGVLSATPEYQAIVDIGANVLTVIVHQGGTPKFIRSMPNTGGDAVIAALMEQLHLDEDRAQTLMIETGLNGPPPNVTPIAESSVFGAIAARDELVLDPRTKAAMTVINPWATALVGAIRDSLDYFSATATDTGPDTTVSRLVITGRTSQLNGLSERINTELRIPVEQLHPFAMTSQSRSVKNVDDQSLAVAIGLAMGA